MKLYWKIILICLLNITIAFGQFKPSVVTKQKKVTPPILFEDCFFQLDSILQDSFKLEIKNLPIDIATIKLESTIGQYLLFKWKLNYNPQFSGKGKYGFRYDAPIFINDFFAYGIKEPNILRRVIFRSYHKHLNNLSINFRVESDYFKTLLGQNTFEVSHIFGMYSTTQNKTTLLSHRISQCEDSILNDYKATFMSKNDTVGILVWNNNYLTKCVLSGTIVKKGVNNNSLIHIFDISCSNRNTYAIIDSKKINLCDTISYDLRHCLKLNYNYPTYEPQEFYMWNNYIKEKYGK